MHSLPTDSFEEAKKKSLNDPWPKFLAEMTICGLRGWTGQRVQFHFPVVALAGENGSGKSTVLKAAAAAYAHPTDRELSFYPSTFFPDTAWESTAQVSLKYSIREGTQSRGYSISKKSQRWRFSRNRPKRYVVFQDVSRTLPIESTVGYARLAKRGATEHSAEALGQQTTKFYSSIMGRHYDEARIAHSSLDVKRPIGVVRASGVQYSQYHQGAGEDATLDLLSLLQNIADTALILLDEAEASLHPRSQRRLVHFLLWLARTKHIQVILTTHSPYILEELPEEARIFLERGTGGVSVLYGTSVNYALNRMDDLQRPDLFIFVEDQVSKTFLDTLLRQNGVDLSRIRIIEAGPCNLVQAIGQLANDSRLPHKSLGCLDGDQSTARGCIKLPGTKPLEKQVFEDVLQSAVPFFATRLALVEDIVRDALSRASTLTDHHSWPEQAAVLIGNLTRDYLWTTMCQVWVAHCASNDPSVGPLIEQVQNHLR